MKIIHTFFLIVCTAFICTGSTPVVSGNSVKKGDKTVSFYKGGSFLLHGKEIRCQGSLTIGTMGGYFSFGSRNIKSSFSKPEKGVFLYKGTVPANKNGASMEVSEEVSLTPMGSLEFQITWKCENMRDAKDMFFGLRFPMAHFKDQKVLVGTQEVLILNQSKYGFFVKDKLSDPGLDFYNWDKARKFTIQCEGNIKVVMQSTKDKEYLLRIYPPAGSNTLRFTLSFQ